MPRAPARANARTIATPTARLKAGSTRVASREVQPSDMARLSPNGAIQRRPRRPRPACCNSLDADIRLTRGRRREPEQSGIGRIHLEQHFQAPQLERMRSRAARREYARASSSSTGFGKRYPRRASVIDLDALRRLAARFPRRAPRGSPRDPVANAAPRVRLTVRQQREQRTRLYAARERNSHSLLHAMLRAGAHARDVARDG